MYTLRPALSTEEANNMSLRDHLLAAQNASSPNVDDMQDTSGHEGHHIDPQIGPSSFSPSPNAPGMEPQNPDVRKGRRELSTSKRAAQNRAAQRAFRQRKEQYISTLKSQVGNYEQMATSYKNLENENLVLREYIITLQSRLLESGHAEFPPAPIDLSRPSVRITAAAAAAAAAVVAADRNQGNDMSVEEQLQAAAAAAAHHASEIGQHGRREEEEGNDDDIHKIDNGGHGQYLERSMSAEAMAEQDHSEGSHVS